MSRSTTLYDVVGFAEAPGVITEGRREVYHRKWDCDTCDLVEAREALGLVISINVDCQRLPRSFLTRRNKWFCNFGDLVPVGEE